MEPTFQTTSFIPKKSLVTVKEKGSKSVSLFTLIAIIILILAILFSVFAYMYGKRLSTEVETLKRTLDQAQEKFDPVTLQNLQKLDKQISNAETLLDNHITLSPILVNVLNANTLKKVQYTQFTHTVSGVGKSAKIQVRLTGKAESLPYVALQSKKLAENRYVQNPLFSDIVTAKDNTVTFNLFFDISPNLIVYSQVINNFNGTTEPITSNGTAGVQ
jgi:hypothetical protein